MNHKPLIRRIKTPVGYYFYDTNRNSIMKISESTYNSLEELSENQNETCIKNLLKKGYLSEKRILKIKHPEVDYIRNHIETKLNKLTLQVTQQCNLKCKYCAYAYPEKGKQRSHANKKMDFNVAKKAIDLFLEHSIDNKEINFGFYGGEPLLEFDLIKKCVEYIKLKANKRSITYSITTNGTLFSKDTIEFLINNNFITLISFDGPKAIHNKNRQFYDNSGSYDLVVSNIRKIIKSYPKAINMFSINSVMDPENSFSCYNDFFINFDILKDIDFHVNSLNSNLVENSFVANKGFIVEREYEKFKYYLYLVNEISDEKISPIIKKAFIGIRMFLNRIELKKQLNDEMHHGGPCIPGVRRLFCDVNGNLFPCERCSEESRIMRIGDIFNGIDIDAAMQLLNIGEITDDECKNCWNIRFCSICAVQIDNNSQLSYDKKKNICTISKITTLTKLRTCIMLSEFGADMKYIRSGK